jgi:hypothetical protein
MPVICRRWNDEIVVFHLLANSYALSLAYRVHHGFGWVGEWANTGWAYIYLFKIWTLITTFLNWNPIFGLIKQEFFGSKSDGTSGVNTSTDSASCQSRESGKLHPKAYCGTPPFGEAGPEPEHPTFTTEVTSPTCDNLGETSATISTRAQHFPTTFPISCCSKWATQLYSATWSC